MIHRSRGLIHRWREIWRWRARIRMACDSPDNRLLPRAQDAGRCRDGYQVMHNGLRVRKDGYYGPGMTELLRRNRGCHEPQEEVIFAAFLKSLPRDAVMLELGAYWAFYSLWFKSCIPGGRAIAVEPCEDHLSVGRENFRLNGMEGEFRRGHVGELESEGSDRTTVDLLLREYGLDSIDVLHADVQGAEMEMLEESEAVATGRVRNLFISTHSEELHAGIVELLASGGFELLASVEPRNSYSVDGLIVARRCELPRIQLPACRLRS